MPMTSLGVVELTESQREALERVIRAGTSAQRLVRRARIVLLAADGHPNAVISAPVAVSVDTVRTWRRRWCRQPELASVGGCEALGSTGTVQPVPVAGVKALACSSRRRPAVRRWRGGAGPPGGRQRALRFALLLHRASVAGRGRDQTLSVPVVDLHQRPDFAAKVQRALDLYARVWDGAPLSENASR